MYRDWRDIVFVSCKQAVSLMSEGWSMGGGMR